MRLTLRRLVALAMVTLFLAASTPQAAMACDPGRAHNIAGRVKGWDREIGGQWANLYGTIEVKDPWVFNNPSQNNQTNFSYGFVMLLSDSLEKWAQIGPARLNDNSRVNFTQCWNGPAGQFVDAYAPAWPVGSNVTFRIDNNLSNGQKTYVEGSAAATCHDSYSFLANHAEAATETKNDSDQVQGTTLNPQGFFAVHGHNLSGTILDLFDDGAFHSNNAASWFHTNKTASDEMQAWDSGC